MIGERIRTRLAADRGTTLAELLVGMGVMVIALVMFTSTLIWLHSSANAIENTQVSSSQTNTAFLQLDKTIRYASSISTPSTVANASANWYVEWQTVNTGSTVCKQLQLNTTNKTLKIRTWKLDPTTGIASNLTAWTMMAPNVTAPASPGVPFTMTSYGNPSKVVDGTGKVVNPTPYEQLVVSLFSTSGTSVRTKTSQLNATFTAVNSATASASVGNGSLAPSTVCQEEGRP